MLREAHPENDSKILMNVLVLLNSASADYGKGCQPVLAYLDHLGLPQTIIDLNYTPLPAHVADYALVIVAHRRLDPTSTRLGQQGHRALLAAVQAGTGLVSFDPTLPAPTEIGETAIPLAVTEAEHIQFEANEHYITAGHSPGETLPLAGVLHLPKATVAVSTALICANKYPVVSSLNVGLGRVVQWTTTDWMHTAILGPLGGLDDVLWRSLVWAARKPFAFRGLPPLVTMRVDDVAGRGGLWGQTPLYWVQTANQHGFKPWLGLFIYNLTEPTTVELRDLVQRGQATAFPHAFGRPPRTADSDFYYYEQAYPWRATEYDEFIYFDHQKRRPWPDDEAARGLAAVDEWYQAHAPLPISPYAVAHWYEMGHNVMAHVREQWHAEFIGKTQDADLPLTNQTSWLKSGPFRRYEQPGTARPAAVRRGQRPVYYADFINLGGQQFFNCVTEIRDDAGYEWRPDQDVAATVGRGVRQLRRAFDSMALAVLFTHETDYIYKISPDAWADEIAQVAAGIAAYNPIYVTLDEGIRYVRATRTSQLKSAYYDPAAGIVAATFTGFTDTPTHFYLFSESGDKITSSLVEVPVFEGECIVTK